MWSFGEGRTVDWNNIFFMFYEHDSADLVLLSERSGTIQQFMLIITWKCGYVLPHTTCNICWAQWRWSAVPALCLNSLIVLRDVTSHRSHDVTLWRNTAQRTVPARLYKVSSSRYYSTGCLKCHNLKTEFKQIFTAATWDRRLCWCGQRHWTVRRCYTDTVMTAVLVKLPGTADSELSPLMHTHQYHNALRSVPILQEQFQLTVPKTEVTGSWLKHRHFG